MLFTSEKEKKRYLKYISQYVGENEKRGVNY